MKLTELNSILACPECRHFLEEVSDGGRAACYTCSNCQTIYPIKDNILILLPKLARNYELEYPLVEKLTNMLPEASYIEPTFSLLESAREVKSWEWQDEVFWRQEYREAGLNGSSKNWNDRLWQREILVNKLIKKTSLSDKIIADCGSGEGQNFRHLLLNHCSADTLYIATDISIDGLLLNRNKNPHENAVYILCTAESLPFRVNTIDVICYFGILHHTKSKENLLCKNIPIMKRHGYVLLHEPIYRPSVIPNIFKEKIVESEHEERIQQKELDRVLGNGNLEVILTKRMYSLLFYAVFRLLKGWIVQSKKSFRLLTKLDSILMWPLQLIPHFRPSDVLALIRRK